MSSDITVNRLRELQSTINESIESYVSTLSAANPPQNDREEAELRIASAAEELAAMTRVPFRDVMEIGFGGTVHMCMRIAINLDLFNIITEKGISLGQMVEKTGADEVLLLRLMRLLVARRVFIESKEGRVYSSTKLSETLRHPPMEAWLKTTFDSLQPIWSKIPAWLKKNGYNDIQDLKHNPTLEMHGKNLWDHFTDVPEEEKQFATAMKIQDQSPKIAIPDFPYDEGIKSFNSRGNKDGVFIVDVGGGGGQALSYLLQETPNVPGKKILQDLPTVIKSNPPSDEYEMMAHDFFTPQPVVGAKYYHLRGILHDWPDASCISILENLKPGLEKGYSRVLIQTFVLLDVGCRNVREPMLDVNMWTCCGIERNKSQWEALLDKAGYEIVKLVMAQFGSMSMIEAKLKGDA